MYDQLNMLKHLLRNTHSRHISILQALESKSDVCYLCTMLVHFYYVQSRLVLFLCGVLIILILQNVTSHLENSENKGAFVL